MPFAKGHQLATGRKNDVPNKTTKVHREFFQHLLDQNSEQINDALADVFGKDKEAYLKIILAMSEFVVPKLNRITHAGDEDNPINQNLTVTIYKRGFPQPDPS